jgi:hypothetical protein
LLVTGKIDAVRARDVGRHMFSSIDETKAGHLADDEKDVLNAEPVASATA